MLIYVLCSDWLPSVLTLLTTDINIENKYLFTFLNGGNAPTFLTWLGRSFHNFSARTENAVFSYIFVLSVGVGRRPRELERNTRDDF